MSVLSAGKLRELMAEEEPKKRLVVTPLLDDTQISGTSVDLRLGSEFLSARRTGVTVLDPHPRHAEHGEIVDPERQVRQLESRRTVPIGQAYVLHPQQFVLASTLEFVRIPHGYHAMLEGRSSWTRQGLVVRSVTNIAPGFAGVLTLVMVNQGEVPIRIYPGLRIAQLLVARIETTQDPEDREFEYSRTGAAKYIIPMGPSFGRLERDLDWPLIEEYNRQRLSSSGTRTDVPQGHVAGTKEGAGA
ncbi:MAG TPA: dCTP deaminase [Longimicrobium sp.]|nr:dCTP deaminase [Longimicrobium sp.]